MIYHKILKSFNKPSEDEKIITVMYGPIVRAIHLWDRYI